MASQLYTSYHVTAQLRTTCNSPSGGAQPCRIASSIERFTDKAVLSEAWLVLNWVQIHRNVMIYPNPGGINVVQI